MPLTLCSVFRFRSRFARVVYSLIVVTCICCGGRGVAAASNSEDALRHGRIGLEEFNAGRWNSALDEFSRADSIMHSPVFRLYSARCMQRLGQWLEAREQYLGLTEMPIGADDPQPWQKAVADARLELTALNAEFPAVRIIVGGSSSAAARPVLTIDGHTIESSRWTDHIELSPGDHVAILLDNDKPLVTRKFSVVPGDRAQVIELQVPLKSRHPVVPKAALVALPNSRAPTLPRAEPRVLEHPYRTAGTVAVGIGAVGVAIGAVCGLWAWHERNALLDRCAGNQCPPEEQARWHRADQAANLATTSLIVGGLNLVVGGYLFYFAPSTGSSRNGNGAAPRELSLGLTRSF